MIKFKKIKNVLAIFLVGFVFSLTSCSVDASNLYPDSKDYQVDSSYSETIKERSVSLTFEINTLKVSGTGWIWKNEGDYYYIATNMHVAGAVTFAGYKFKYFEDSSAYDFDCRSSTLTSSIGFIYGDTNQPEVVKVNNPKVVYTTIEDENFNSVVNYDTHFYYQDNEYDGISDICILRYYLPSDSIGYDFADWLEAYQSYPTQIYDKSINLSKYTFYSGGFPSIEGSQTWTPLSDFTVNKAATNEYSKGWEYLNNEKENNSAPITFVDTVYASNKIENTSTNDYSSDITNTNFLNAAYNGYFYAYLDKGASGSLLGTIIDNTFYVVGIYWGVTTFIINDKNRELGSFDLFVNSGYNLVTSIDEAISNDWNNLSTSSDD